MKKLLLLLICTLTMALSYAQETATTTFTYFKKYDKNWSLIGESYTYATLTLNSTTKQFIFERSGTKLIFDIKDAQELKTNDGLDTSFFRCETTNSNGAVTTVWIQVFVNDKYGVRFITPDIIFVYLPY